MEEWLRYLEAVSPDVVKRDLDTCKIIGSCALATAGKLLIDGVFPIISANMMVAVTGPSGSAKSWIVNRVFDGMKGFKIEPGTPEKVAELVERWRVGIYVVNEIGGAIRNARRGGYMSEWGENILLPLYEHEELSQRRRRKSRDITVPPRSYYVSMLSTGTDMDYASIFELWPTLKRRLLMVRLTTPTPLRAWQPSGEGAEALANLTSMYAALSRAVALVKMDPEPVNRLGERLEDRVEDPYLARLMWHYSVKLAACWALDAVMAEALERVRRGRSTSTVDVLGEPGKQHRSAKTGVTWEVIKIRGSVTRGNIIMNGVELSRMSMSLSMYEPLLNSHECLDTLLQVSMSVGCLSGIIDAVGAVIDTQCRLSGGARRIAEAVDPDLEKLCRRLLALAERHRALRKRDFLRKIDGLNARRRDEALEVLAARGEVVVRGSTVIHAGERCCGTCLHYHREGCPKGRAASPLDPPCDSYRGVET